MRALMLALVVLLAACGGTAPTPSATPTPTPSPSPIPAAVTKTCAVLRTLGLVALLGYKEELSYRFQFDAPYLIRAVKAALAKAKSVKEYSRSITEAKAATNLWSKAVGQLDKYDESGAKLSDAAAWVRFDRALQYGPHFRETDREACGLAVGKEKQAISNARHNDEAKAAYQSCIRKGEDAIHSLDRALDDCESLRPVDLVSRHGGCEMFIWARFYSGLGFSAEETATEVYRQCSGIY